MRNQREKEIVRGKILYYLKLIFPQSATLPLLQGELDIFGYPVAMEELEAHVAFLKEKKLLAVESVRTSVSKRRIVLAQISTRGLCFLAGSNSIEGISKCEEWT